MKKFYSHLIELDTVFVELDSIELSESEKHQLSQLIDSNLHTTVMDAILSELSEADKKVLLDHLQNEDHDKIWEHLNDKTENIEDKIKLAAADLKNQLHHDIKESKRIKKP